MRLSPSSMARLGLAKGSILLFCASAFVSEPLHPESCEVCSATYCHSFTQNLWALSFSSGKKEKRKRDAGKLSDHVVALLADPGAHPHAGDLPKSPGIPYTSFTSTIQALGCLPAPLHCWISPAKSCCLYRKGCKCWEEGAVVLAHPSWHCAGLGPSLPWGRDPGGEWQCSRVLWLPWRHLWLPELSPHSWPSAAAQAWQHVAATGSQGDLVGAVLVQPTVPSPCDDGETEADSCSPKKAVAKSQIRNHFAS